MAIKHIVTRGYGSFGAIKQVVTRGFFDESGVVTAALSGTVISGLTAAKLVTGGETIILTLTNATWNAAGAAFDDERQNIIDGLTSSGIEATGWNAEIRDKEVVGAVVRTSNTVVTITLSASAAYSVVSSETVTATIPDTAISDALPVVASPTFIAGVVVSTGEIYKFGSGGFTASRFLLGNRR